MTVQYQGNNIYKVYIGDNFFVMSNEEIVSIANYAHTNTKDFDTIKANEEESYIDGLEKDIEELTQSNKDWEFEVKKLAEQIEDILLEKQ